MTILRTYARLWADDVESALPLLRRLTGQEPHLRFAFQGVDLAAVGDFLVIAGPAEERAQYAHASATVVVDDLDALRATLEDAGAVLTTPLTEGGTGRFLYARHPDGSGVEYVEWAPELVREVLGAGEHRGLGTPR
ncbi:VOC family protein [Streptomyces sp. NPDC005438]|uniref:VOC family protein n=1 Tax=Streptomyces sp. NPDC005438 TaxID=3156880 RepID=UPI0033AB14D3